MHIFEYNQTTLHYVVSGKGKPVFLLHGFLEDHRMWNTISPHFETWGFQVYSFDLPCHGKSRFDGENCSMFTMAELLHAFCMDQKIEIPYVFGHSMGGYVGLELLKLRPINLTLVHSNFWADSAAKKKDRNRFMAVVQKNKPLLLQEAIPRLFAPQNREKCYDAIQELLHHALKIPASEIMACTRGMRDREDNSAILNTTSIHLIQGDLDGVVDMNMLNRRVKKLNQNHCVYIIENCGHVSIWESPDALINYFKLIVFK